MVRGIGLSALCLCVAASALIGKLDPSPIGLQHPRGFATNHAPVENETKNNGEVKGQGSNVGNVSTRSHTAKRKDVDIPGGMRALLVMLVKNHDVEDERILPGTKVDLLIQEGNNKESDEWRILLSDVLYLGMPGCVLMRGNADDIERAREMTEVNIALTPEDAGKLYPAVNSNQVRLVVHAPQDEADK